MAGRSTELGERIRRLREERGYSLSELARRSHLARSYIYQLESGESSPTHEKLQDLAAALGVPISSLLGLDGEKTNVPESLREFAARYNVPETDVQMLARIQYRGKQPDSPAAWRALYAAIQATAPDEEL
jgi:transcriptional regulator with XRE-family HTH domain